MRVMLVHHFQEYGGPHNRSLQLSRPLADIGIESIVLLPPGVAERRLREAGLTVRAMDLGRVRAVRHLSTQAKMIGRFPKDIVSLRKAMLEVRPDVVQLHGLMNPHAAIAAKSLGIPVVWQLVDTRPPPLVRALVMKVVTALADVLMTTGEAVAAAHPGAEAFGERLIPFFAPVQTEHFAPSPRGSFREDHQIPRNAPLIGVVANVNPQKGHEYIIEAFATIRRTYPDARLVVVGHLYETHESYFFNLRKQVSRLGLSIGKDVIFLGARNDVATLLPEFDVLALASVPNSEGAPTAILEAMSSGVPVVASNVGSVSEIVIDRITGFLVEPRQPSLLADRISYILGDKSVHKRMSIASRQRILDHFSLEQCVEAHVRAYALAMKRH